MKFIAFKSKSFFISILISVFVIFIIGYFFHKNENVNKFLSKKKNLSRNKIKNEVYSKNWVVITSIFAPTKAVEVFSKMEGWKVLVVGDKKTPKGWNFNNVLYLSPEDQEDLPFSSISHIPWNRYTRKLVGYLYAIQRGAEFIYESDDDNEPNQNLDLFDRNSSFRLILNTEDRLFNPYAHFGQSSTWPRGYPLNSIGLPISRSYTLCLTSPPNVVQSLVNGDPDMDAVFRLTRRYAPEKIDIKFDPQSPIFIYPINSYTPFNSQNTLFHKSAFWGLFFPISVTDRATDIYRSYWTQRLMWLIGQKVAFGPATFYQLRSPHNLINDFTQEIELYKYMKNFIDALHNWKCSSSSFMECILQATRMLVEKKFWKEEDFRLATAWLIDLKNIDPSLVDIPLIFEGSFCLTDEQVKVTLYPNEQKTTMPHSSTIFKPPLISNDEFLHEINQQKCSDKHRSANENQNNTAQDILLIKISSQPEKSISYFLSLYQKYFIKIIFCISEPLNQTFINKYKPSLLELFQSNFSLVSCLRVALRLGIKSNGVFAINENNLLNIQNVLKLLNDSYKKIVLMESLNQIFNLPNCDSKRCFNVKKSDFERIEKKLKEKNYFISNSFIDILTNDFKKYNQISTKKEVFVYVSFHFFKFINYLDSSSLPDSLFLKFLSQFPLNTLKTTPFSKKTAKDQIHVYTDFKLTDKTFDLICN